MKIERLSLTDAAAMAAWDVFIEKHPQASPSHLSCWLSAVQETYGFEPLLYIAKNDDGFIDGVFPLFKIHSHFTGKRIVSLPFSDYGGPLCNHDGAQQELLAYVKNEHASDVRYLEIRGNLGNGSGYLLQNYYKQHVLDLKQGIDAIHNLVDKKTILYSVRKAEKSGVQIKFENNSTGLDAFYHLNNLTRRKHGVPCQPRVFFENLFSKVLNTGHGFILTAYHENRIIAASVFLTIAKQIQYKYNASDPMLLKKYSPNHLLTWHVINWGIQNGFESLDFGRTSPDNAGLIRYKNLWGMKDIDLPYYYFPKVQGAVSIKESDWGYRVMTNIWRHMPLGIMEKVSPYLFKHLG